MPPDLAAGRQPLIASATPAHRAALLQCMTSSNLNPPVLLACAVGRKAKLNVVPLEELMKQNEELGQMFGWCALWC
jgi:hypothetical protein